MLLLILPPDRRYGRQVLTSRRTVTVGMEIYQHPVGQDELPTSSCFGAAIQRLFATALLLLRTVNGDMQCNSHGAIRNA